MRVPWPLVEWQRGFFLWTLGNISYRYLQFTINSSLFMYLFLSPPVLSKKGQKGINLLAHSHYMVTEDHFPVKSSYIIMKTCLFIISKIKSYPFYHLSRTMFYYALRMRVWKLFVTRGYTDNNTHTNTHKQTHTNKHTQICIYRHARSCVFVSVCVCVCIRTCSCTLKSEENLQTDRQTETGKDGQR